MKTTRNQEILSTGIVALITLLGFWSLSSQAFEVKYSLSIIFLFGVVILWSLVEVYFRYFRNAKLSSKNTTNSIKSPKLPILLSGVIFLAYFLYFWSIPGRTFDQKINELMVLVVAVIAFFGFREVVFWYLQNKRGYSRKRLTEWTNRWTIPIWYFVFITWSTLKTAIKTDHYRLAVMLVPIFIMVFILAHYKSIFIKKSKRAI